VNGRILQEETPEGRLAAVVKTLFLEMRRKFANRLPEYREPDYADIRDTIKPFLDREICAARLKEAEWNRTLDFREVRIRELTQELLKLTERLPEIPRPDPPIDISKRR
jgi:hypothetical protein